jgi:asparagine synthase (glutamine-hydrolysing)
MSAILGVLGAPGEPPDGADLEAMRAAASLWGGDGERRWSDGGVALAQLLARVTCSRAGAPAADSLPRAVGVTVAADVRLDNRAELAERLGLDGHDPPPDEDLVLRAYLRFGERAPEHLLGAFAFAVWDDGRGRLVCARDQVGLRPLAYWRGPAGFVFATDPRAVAAHSAVPARADEEALVARFAACPALLRERSPYAGVAKLPAGELLVVEPGGPVRRRRHWLPERGPRDAPRDPDAAAAALRGALRTAVAAAADTDAAVGVHLSGGLDSSAVAALGARSLAARGRGVAAAYCWSPPARVGGDEPEHARVEKVARAIGAPVAYTTLGAGDLRAEAERVAALDPSEMLVYEQHVLRHAAADGVGVLLTGWGGDEVASFNGRGQLAWLALRGRWLRAVREAAAPARGARARRRVRTAAVNLRRGVLVPLLPDAAYLALGLGVGDLERQLERRGCGWAALDPGAPAQRRDMRLRARVRPSARATQLTGLAMGHLEQRIEAWAHAGARHGVDHRYPLLDRRVIELCLSLPGDVWLRDGWTRWVFREAVAPFLKRELVWTREKEEPARMGAWLALLADAPLDEVSGGSPLVRSHRARQRETARILTGR